MKISSVTIGIALMAMVTVPSAWAQFTTQRDAFAAGTTDAIDNILARRVAMSTLGRQNDQIHDIIDGVVPKNEDLARLYLDNISVFLLTIPHMFPEGSDVFSKELEAEEPATVTYALPAVWTNWNDFYSRALTASDTAFNASRADTWEELADLTIDLEGQCESCHNDYRQAMEPIDPLGLGATTVGAKPE
jgi:cytochrome c556